MGKKVTVLGSTGSIGRQTLEVIAASNGEYEVLGISGDRNAALLAEQALRFRPRYVAAKTAMEPDGLPQGTELLCGSEGVCELAGAAEADIVVNGISGFAALRPLLAALKAGKRVALANKESVVCGKQLVDAALKANGGEIMPVDSEQSALFQCMKGGERREIRKLLLTASGGRFWNRPFAALAEITLEEALSHPTWNMGQKITIDSATLFNKGLEVIEASYLFDIPGERIEVLIHPQSVVHSLVEFCDGTVIGNLSVPDMRLPIQYALTYPERKPSPCRRLSLADVGLLEFHPAPEERYPALRFAYRALREGGTMPTVYNGANEAAVKLFMERRIRFTDIYAAVEYALDRHMPSPVDSLETVFDADWEARALGEAYFGR